MSVEELPDPDFPFLRGPVRACHVCWKNKPTDTVHMFKDQENEWIGVCEECQKAGA